jgi:hypothetical protein
MNKYSPLLFVMIFSFLFGDANVQIRLQNGQKVQGEFVGTYMNHVHILVEEKIIYYACDDITSITYSTILRFDYDCSINTVTADILFPPELDPMTGEMTNMLPDVFNPDIPKPAAKVEDGGVSTEQTVVLDNQKDLLYLKKKRDPALAGTLSFFTHFMGLGHYYGSGGDVKVWLRSIPYSLAMFYFISQAEKKRDEHEQRPEYDIYGDPFEPPRHLLIAVYAAYIGLIWDSVYMTRKYNIKLHKEIYDYEIKKVSELKQFESEMKLRQAL